MVTKVTNLFIFGNSVLLFVFLSFFFNTFAMVMNTRSSISHSLNVGGRLLSLDCPQVMGILNATTESFYAASRTSSGDDIVCKAKRMLEEGASILDIGGCSTKPGLAPVSEEEEMRRLSVALEAIRHELPDAILSVDTFRASVAERCVREYGVQVINDVYGGQADERMFATVADLQVPYVLTYDGAPWCKLMYDLAERIEQLRLMGVNDIIVDPGFGFGKTLDENYHLMAHLEELHLLGCPVLVGVSRKSMIYKQLDCTPEEALNGTTVLHTVALMKGAHILRVHDVRAAAEAVKIVEKLKSQKH